jgi:hypothetical protein
MSMEDLSSAPHELNRIPFGPKAESEILALSFWLRTTGIVNCIAAVMNLMSLANNLNAGPLINLALNAFLGMSVLNAAEAFKMIATTDRADQAYLVIAFRKLHNIFMVQAIMILLGVAVMCIVLFCLLVAAVLGAGISH